MLCGVDGGFLCHRAVSSVALSGIEVIYVADTSPHCEAHCELLLRLIKKLSKVLDGSKP